MVILSWILYSTKSRKSVPNQVWIPSLKNETIRTLEMQKLFIIEKSFTRVREAFFNGQKLQKSFIIAFLVCFR